MFIAGLSGVLPSVIALAQGAYVSPSPENSSLKMIHNRSCDQGSIPIHFSVSTYFATLTAFVICSMMSFLVLYHYCLPQAKQHDSYSKEQESSLLKDENKSVKFRSLMSDDSSSDDSEAGVTVSVCTETQGSFWSKKMAVLLFLEMLISCIGNGLAPAVSSFAFSSYGNTAAVTIVNIGMISGPVTALVAVKLAWKNSVGKKVFMTLGVLVITAMALNGYIIWLATTLSPPLQGHAEGVVLVVRDIDVHCVYVFWG